jgi:SAM-dependent methyltransferase
MNLPRIYLRFLRRRRVGMAYDMAKEIAMHVPASARVLDVGCGSGYIAHHLGALLGVPVQGTDVGPDAEASIAYRRFDGGGLPFASGSFDVVLFCYVLHHASDARVLLAEAARVLTPSGRLVIYEDTPRAWIDRWLCYRHERQWLRRTGPCTFRRDSAWRQLFNTLGLDVTQARALSRLRDPTYPVARSLYVLRKHQATEVVAASDPGPGPAQLTRR